jgi:hypothetical protein
MGDGYMTANRFAVNAMKPLFSQVDTTIIAENIVLIAVQRWMVMGMAREICAYCHHCEFTTVPLWISGKGGCCKVKDFKFVDPRQRKRFCRKFMRRKERQ